MSATNRGAVRAVADYYPTPSWCVRRILEKIDAPAGLTWLEPCAGDGALVRALRAHDAKAEIGAFELREDAMSSLHRAGADVSVCCDALLLTDWPTADVVLMNPPFSRAIEFCKKAIDSRARLVVCLERLTWLCTWGKADSRMPSMFVLPDRPSFIGAGRVDASEYAWFVWGLQQTVVEMLPRTALTERKAG